MSHSDPNQPFEEAPVVPVEPPVDDESRPLVSVDTRKIVYIVALIVGLLSMLAGGLADIWWPDNAGQIQATADLIVGVLAAAAGALGITYAGKRGV